MEERSERTGLIKAITLWDGVAVVVGGVIGSGIFLVPRSVSEQVTSLLAVLLVWFLGGLLSLAGALSLAELGGALPRTGGLYVYLRECYGNWAGFLYGWALITMINSGTIATLGVAFSLYCARILPLGFFSQKVIGIASILVLTWVNYRGVRLGTRVQNIFTLAKVAGLATVILVLLSLGHPLTMWSRGFWPASGLHFSLAPFGIALIAVLWAYEGWYAVTFSAGEFVNAQRDLPRSLALGTLGIVVIYLLANLAYYAVLPGSEVAKTDTVAASAMSLVMGPAAAALVAVLILTSIAGANNAQVLTGPRVFYAMARDGIFFASFSKVHPRHRSPAFSILVQGIIASSLTLVGTFQELFTYVVFTHWIFYAAAVAGVIILRRRRPGLNRPFRVPAYPWVPAAFILASLGLIATTIAEDPYHSLVGIGAILTGLPAYALFRRFSPTAPKEPAAIDEAGTTS